MSRDAEKAFRDKMLLESRFINDLGRILRSPIDSQRRELERFLLGHYNRTYDRFSRNYQNRVDVEMPRFQRLTMRDYVQREFQERAYRQSGLISENTRKIWDRLPDLPLAEKRNMFQFRMGVRSVAIAATETEWSAEHTKLREVQFLQGGPESNSGVKRWDVIGDARMREHHAFAAGQVVGISEAFAVDGESLLYPGDSSLGATASNLVNCRCSAFYSVSREDLTRAS